MKPLTSLNNIQRARLLHELFPSEVPALLEFVKTMCQSFKERENVHRITWESSLFEFDFWLSFVNETERKIEQYGNKLNKSSSLFANQLFDGYLAIYVIDCLSVYTTMKENPNRKINLAIDLLFNP
ncbi:hypothetical protein [Mucilaginibacter sp. L3T2-6]|uniref:hypothetical protein n=1 Tax=Mucilaginibacter sp. L3T2-6 TaxID=3062491 RepID=UPI00267532FD|nr:hypothetical protein [Mucilaginibacter sp. L3T2-6]MDO3641507.1 hypothetical protein [Mucilaginibacter sp. L3T2-6]MDV6213732.1 hypothetical protein [Mucilaginibacter sp. L3T2-6]